MNELGNTPADKNYKPSGISRSEEAALKAYPKKDGKVWTSKFGSFEFDGNYDGRKAYQEGYEQAEKDLALTWEDIKEIQHLSDVVWSEQEISAPIDEDTIYKEVLKRFKEAKR